MIEPVRIEPNAIYDDGALTHSLGLSQSALVNARRSGRLRFTRQGKRVIYLGQWILAWLNAEAAAPGEEVAHAS
jgi:hypothetical protein